ncbi:hypothetical protein OZ411_31135 [Bradyrhizobium sp. Arg237L]|uniref:hypothetical protein n=1 Tax=Bradyrhizobium sp. Arg237L TaxID=3003352 RepID=UPI00249E065B|nr:hypothetical protein [Bradyrhizobium sp. Arg237L]MDI4237268.1 hypothetical protein [Bradyrhizobium sp. Arg237L]
MPDSTLLPTCSTVAKSEAFQCELDRLIHEQDREAFTIQQTSSRAATQRSQRAIVGSVF